MKTKTMHASFSIFAGLCVTLFVLCRLQVTAPAEAYSAFHSAGYHGIPILLGICGLLSSQSLVGWKSQLLSALAVTVLLAVLCGAALVSAGLIQELLRFTHWGGAVLVLKPGMDASVMHPYLFSALAGVSMGFYSFFVLSIIGRLTFGAAR